MSAIVMVFDDETTLPEISTIRRRSGGAGQGGDLDPDAALQRQAQAGGVRAELDHFPHACNGMNARSHR